MSDAKINPNIDHGPPSDVEEIKEQSNYLRGSLVETLNNPISAGIPEDDNRLMKFHGSYMQDDRDLRVERQKQKLEPAYQFMVRVRVPGGIATADQWLVLDELAHKYGNGTLRVTTRQAIQMHGILKWNMKKNMQGINDALMDSLAACGDVNRNVMCNPNPYQSEAHEEVYDLSSQLSAHLTPETNAYHEIWLDGEKVVDSEKKPEKVEPIYGNLYLPRKFKIGIAIPPSNDVDVYSQDIGFIAILDEANELIGFNVAVGGGMGMTHGDHETYPQLARVIGFIPKTELLDVAEKIVTIQRDYGNRSIRKNARFKYTIDARGFDWIKSELNDRLGWEIEEARPYTFEHNGDRYGWIKGTNDKWNLTLFIQNGRIKDTDEYPMMTGLREIAKIHKGDFRLTANQNVIIGDVAEEEKATIEALVKKHHLTDGKEHSALKRNSMACVAFPTCGLAMAEAERYLPDLIEKIEVILDANGLRDEEIIIRMSGCPNGCSRAAIGEIGFIGRGPGKYNMYLGAGFAGERLNKLYRENVGEEQILAELAPIIKRFATEREAKEHFGDFVVRTGIVEAVTCGTNFHA